MSKMKNINLKSLEIEENCKLSMVPMLFRRDNIYIKNLAVAAYLQGVYDDWMRAEKEIRNAKRNFEVKKKQNKVSSSIQITSRYQM